MTISLLEAYERSSEASRFAFEWLYYKGEPAGEENPGRVAWFHYGESGTERWCSHCGATLYAETPCWVSGSTGFVLCVKCVASDEVGHIQSGIFTESFKPTYQT